MLEQRPLPIQQDVRQVEVEALCAGDHRGEELVHDAEARGGASLNAEHHLHHVPLLAHRAGQTPGHAPNGGVVFIDAHHVSDPAPLHNRHAGAILGGDAVLLGANRALQIAVTRRGGASPVAKAANHFIDAHHQGVQECHRLNLLPAGI